MRNRGAMIWGLRGMVLGAGLVLGLGTTAGCGDNEDGKASCDCGTDVDAAKIPLACACEAGLCTTFADDLAKYQRSDYLAFPNYVLLGTCDDGYRTLSYEQATEDARRLTYDADGHMVYDRFDGYGGVEMPKGCGFTTHLSLGSSTVGEDPSKNCSYCLVTANDEHVPGIGEANGGAGGASGAPYYPQSRTPPCDPALLE